jgi:2-hydroxychromene-2-carboxylate isomerase
LRDLRRSAAARQRKRKGAAPTVLYFHDPDDAYSQLTLQVLDRLTTRYAIEIKTHLVPPPIAAAAPEPERLIEWSIRDAALLAKTYGLKPKAPAALIKALPKTDAETLAANGTLREKLGHYLGATFYFEGEWYWGLDRLHYLEARLSGQGLDRLRGAATFPPREIVLDGPKHATSPRVLHAFISFRSPYSYICLPRAKQLAEHYGAELRIRFVMPMVMRGLPVPRAKSWYITTDTKREAERVGLRFGTIVDPVGLGVERGLAVLNHAIKAGKGYEFALSFTQGAFADGIDATDDQGLLKMAKRAGLSADLVKAALADEGWRKVAEDNRSEMFANGLWGVPSFRVDNGPAHWGQDRLWAIEQELRA